MAPPPTQTLELDKYVPDARALIFAAQQLADERQHPEVEPIHLLHRAVDRDRGIAEVFRKAGADPGDVLAEAESALRRLPKTGKGEAYIAKSFLDLLGEAEREAEREKAQQVTLEHVLTALTRQIRGAAGAVLQAMRIEPGSLKPHYGLLKTTPRDSQPMANGAPAASAGGSGSVSWSDLLSRATVDLVEQAKKGQLDPVIGRDTEVRRVLQILERRAKNHPLLVGEPGVGKTSIVRALATRIAHGDVPRNLLGAKILSLDLGGVIAGAKLRGEIEERLRVVLQALRPQEGQKGEAILYIEDFAALFGQASAGAGVGELLKPALVRGDLRILASCSTEGLRKVQEKDPGVLRRLTIVEIDAPDVDKAKQILRGVATRYEKHHDVNIGEGAIAAAVVLAKRYVQDRALPDSAFDLLDEACARKRVELDSVPAEIDDSIRRLDSLKAQTEALKDDQDRLSTTTRKKIEAEIAELEPKVVGLKSHLESRRGAIAAAESLRGELSAKEADLVEAKKKADYARLGELEHVTIPDLKRRLATAEEAVVREGGGASNVVGEEDVAKILEDWTGIPQQKMLEAEADKLLKMEERLTKRVVGQDEATRAVAKAVRRGRIGLRDPGKPIGSFLFLGPSGVGKTELAKILTGIQFGSEKMMVRFDMTEYQDKQSFYRFIGSPDGKTGGALTEAIREKPYCLILLDEFEKTNKDVLNLFLQIIDE